MSKDIKVGDLVEKVRSYHPAANVEVIRKAYEFSANVHRGQRRRSYYGRGALCLRLFNLFCPEFSLCFKSPRTFVTQ